MIDLELPYPPSGNHMWKHTKTGGHYLTDQARAYYANVLLAITYQQIPRGINRHIEVTCTLHPPDKRRRDLDNAWKVLADSLTRSKVWEDDHIVRRLTLQWAAPVKGGKAIVSIAIFDEGSLQC